MTLQLSTAASGVARSAHYVIPTGQTVPIQTLLLEPQRTNLVLRSEEFNTTWSASNVTVTANAIAAPDGATTADLLNATTNGGSVVQAVTFTGNAEKCAAIYLKAGTAVATDVQLWDNTASASRHLVRATWSGGVPTLSTVSGAGTLYPVELVGNGWYRILFSATSVVAANTNQVRIFPASAATGTVYAWGAQAENAVVPSSYIKTEGTTVTRNADSLYFPFTAPPQAMTVYVRGVDIGAGRGGSVLAISDGGLPEPRIIIDDSGLVNGSLYGQWSSGVPQSNSGTGVSSVGNLREIRFTLSAAGVATIAQSLNGAAEVVGTPGSAVPLTATFSAQRIYFALTALPFNGIALTNVLVAAGTQSLSTMRQLAGVV